MQAGKDSGIRSEFARRFQGAGIMLVRFRIGEGVRRPRNKAGHVTDIWLAGANAKREKALAAEMERRYAPRKGDKAKEGGKAKG